MDLHHRFYHEIWVRLLNATLCLLRRISVILKFLFWPGDKNDKTETLPLPEKQTTLFSRLIDRSELDLHHDEMLGVGKLKRVWRLCGVLRERGEVPAVKVFSKELKANASSTEKNTFLEEANILAKLEHAHIVRFLGVCHDQPPLLIMERVFFGDLLEYLRDRRSLAKVVAKTQNGLNEIISKEKKASISSEALTKFAWEAASALAYLDRCRIVHRDIRAKSFLVDEQCSLKLGCFGMARPSINGKYINIERIKVPVLWMAPEIFNYGVYSSASDVWAFGVLVTELVTFGRVPYDSESAKEVIRHVRNGGMPQLPSDANDETRALVYTCCQRSPKDRPTAEDLVEWLEEKKSMLHSALDANLYDVDFYVDRNAELEEMIGWSLENKGSGASQLVN